MQVEQTIESAALAALKVQGRHGRLPTEVTPERLLRLEQELTEKTRALADLAILRTTPALLGLFSLVTLLAHQHARRRKLPIRQAAWYHKSQPTFSDALALVRRQIWQQECFSMAHTHADNPKLAARIQDRLLSALCYTP